MGGHARPYFKLGRALPAHNSNFDAYACGSQPICPFNKQLCIVYFMPNCSLAGKFIGEN